MAEFTVNTNRFDPYKSHMFRVKWDGVYVAGLSKMSPLKRTTAPVTHPITGAPLKTQQPPPGVTLSSSAGPSFSFDGLGRPIPNAAVTITLTSSIADDPARQIVVESETGYVHH